MLQGNLEPDGTREGRGPYDYPPIQNPSVTFDRDQNKVSIVGQAVYPESNRPSGISVRVSMTSESAMQLMRLLQQLQKDEGFEVPHKRLHVVETLERSSKSKSGERDWLASLATILHKRSKR